MASRRKSSVQGTLQPVDVNSNRRFTLGPNVPNGQPNRKSLGGGRRVSTVPAVKPGVATNPPGQPRRQSIMPRTPNRNQAASKANPRR